MDPTPRVKQGCDHRLWLGIQTPGRKTGEEDRCSSDQIITPAARLILTEGGGMAN
ncbi:hypothetical protein M6B38_329560 [Iris pallida]|uniref:Uncharacterized protein n=1 Tax=Iris pallida TaxID=29817 RepID=A0AAX6H528_IRIPA|nr:hypothetical protein M6B38_329560 [Iris pallida]